jgi:hypothetical protein
LLFSTSLSSRFTSFAAKRMAAAHVKKLRERYHGQHVEKQLLGTQPQSLKMIRDDNGQPACGKCTRRRHNGGLCPKIDFHSTPCGYHCNDRKPHSWQGDINTAGGEA